MHGIVFVFGSRLSISDQRSYDHCDKWINKDGECLDRVLLRNEILTVFKA